MKQPEAVLRDLVEQWMAKAELDFRAAERLITDSEPLREIIAFHCQQSAEKYLKAFLVSQKVEFPKTHDLDQLLDLVASVHPTLAAMLTGIDTLSPFGVTIRYPGDSPELLPGQERSIFEVAKLTREAIKAELGQHFAREEPTQTSV